MNEQEFSTIAVLLTCHNRRDKTINCLSALFKCSIPDGFSIDVFLVDDGSTDGTGEAVRDKFPKVNLIKGDGGLFWNGGMRLAWKTAAETKEYDFYFWLNDDTILDDSAFLQIFETYQEARSREKKEVIIVSACRAENNFPSFSYGGRDKNGPVIPNGELQTCKFINGNAVLIPKKVFDNLGNLSNDFTHAIGDNDYGLRAIKKGFKCYTTKEFVATCPSNEEIPDWQNPKISLKKRWELLHTPEGLNIEEYKIFRKKHWGKKWVFYVFKAYLKALMPRLYSKLKFILG